MKQFLRRIALLSALTALLLACADSIVDRGDAYKVWETKPLEYRYEVYAASGKRIDRGEVGSVPPQFVMIDGDVLKMTLGYGTNAYDCVYYRLPEGLKSNAFPNAIAECGDYVLYMGVEDDRAVVDCSDAVCVSFRTLRKPLRKTAGEHVTHAECILGEGIRYVRAVVRDARGRLAWTNPIFLR